jgi:hypothetical protein
MILRTRGRRLPKHFVNRIPLRPGETSRAPEMRNLRARTTSEFLDRRRRCRLYVMDQCGSGYELSAVCCRVASDTCSNDIDHQQRSSSNRGTVWAKKARSVFVPEGLYERSLAVYCLE